mmetsp:Transcript_26557/g.52992  ORF Transcript_26557/g.52992 Transcript_26557/m.52992 type:complete len:215 (+) Transcript_26557:267-911(+)
MSVWKTSAPSFSPASTNEAILWRWASSMTADMSIFFSKEGPTRSFCILALSFATSLSATFSWTRSLEPAQQTWPWLNQMAFTRPSTVESRSAESYTITGDLPPSSKDSLVLVPARVLCRSFPTSVLPVKATLSTSGCSARCCAISLSPERMFTTPFGMPDSLRMSAKRAAESLVDGAGLRTTVFPMAKAGAIFQASISRGKFQGTICAMTPRGS